MNVLVVGNGGREAMLAWKLAQSPSVRAVHVTPAHPGACALDAKIATCDTDPRALALEGKWDLAVIGPEAPLSAGLADELRALGIPTVGPSAVAARLEASKAWAKELMAKANVPTAGVTVVQDLESARAALAEHPDRLVVKADGLAQGKGVVVANDAAEALRAVEGFLDGSYLGKSMAPLLLEEKLTGREVSAFALCRGTEFTWLGTARDHKRLRDGDQGPNTGGMGTVSPVEDFTEEDRLFVEERVFRPLLKTMSDAGCPFQGFLFAGLMRTPAGWRVIEFNVRMGDPETQVLVPLWKTDLAELLLKLVRGEALPAEATLSGHAAHVVMAAAGYPGTEGAPVRSGDRVEWRPVTEGAFVVPAGLGRRDGEWVTRGGRVIGVTGTGLTPAAALARAYAEVSNVKFDGAQWRRDIGRQA